MKFTRERLKEIIEEELQSVTERCWDGYERTPGTREGAPGSCRKKGSVNEEEITDAEEEELKKIRKELEGASKMHKGQADRIGKAVDEGKICDKGISYVIRTDPGGKDIKRGEDGKLKNWSARAAQIASKYCKDPDYGKGRGKDAKDENIEEAEGGLKAWEKENWVHSDGSPCGDPKD